MSRVERRVRIAQVAAGVGGASEIGVPDPDDLLRVVRTALAEDLRYGPDATTAATVPADAVAVGAFTAAGGRRARRGPGRPRGAVDEVLGDGFEELDAALPDGARLAAGEPALVVRAPVRGLLTAERTALNLLCHLSGVATATAAWVDAVAGTGARIRDTRKTLPGLRLLEKYAVRCGGGVNHRLGLGDAVLIKDNHVAAAGSVGAALEPRPGRGAGPAVRGGGRLARPARRGAGAGRGAGAARQLHRRADGRGGPPAGERADAAGVVRRAGARERPRLRRDGRRVPGGRRAHPLGDGAGHRAGPAA